MAKQYITWTRDWVASYYAMDLSEKIKKQWQINPDVFVGIEDTPYNGQDIDPRLISIIDYPEAFTLKPELKNKFIRNYSYGDYVMTEISPEEAVDLCNKWYPAPEGEEAYFKLAEDGFTLIDNMPRPEYM